MINRHECDDLLRGGQAANCGYIHIGTGYLNGKPGADTSAGHNAFVIQADEVRVTGPLVLSDFGEHGYRQVATTRNLYTESTIIKDVDIYRPGRSGFKIADGTGVGDPDEIKNVSLINCYVEDTGTADDPAPSATSYGSDNDFAISAIYVSGFHIDNFRSRRVANNWNGKYIIKLESCARVSSVGGYWESSFAEAVHFDDDWQAIRDVDMHGFRIRACGNGSTQAAVKIFGIQSSARYMFIGGIVHECPSVLNVSTGTGGFAQECLMQFQTQNIAGANLTTDGTYANLKTRFRGMGDLTWSAT